MKNSENWRRRLVTASGIAVAGFAFAMPALADPPVSMAPPVDGGNMQVVTESTVNSGGNDTVFLWSEVPSGQEVTITRGVFDRGGYQLYDDVGETIVVPFSNDNLYVMKFGVSDNGHMYFVDDNGTPILYVPRDGYLENATVNGARWYPFTQDFHPSEPVYLGVAPSWHSFVSMGWYPDMYYWGGYWCHDAFVSGGIFEPTFGLDIVIGGDHFHGWTPYHNYYFDNPAPYRVGWYNRDRYTWASQPHSDRRFWGGGGSSWSRASRPTGPTSRWDTSHVGRTGGSYRVYQPEGSHSWTNRNDGSGNHRFNGDHASSTRVFGGGSSTWSRNGGTSWQGRSGGSFSSGGSDRQFNRGSSWQGRSGGSFSSGGGGRSSGGFSGRSSGSRSGGGGFTSHSSGGGGGRWSH